MGTKLVLYHFISRSVFVGWRTPIVLKRFSHALIASWIGRAYGCFSANWRPTGRLPEGVSPGAKICEPSRRGSQPGRGRG
jgi:hypothetical protein